jgi:hypothetical protein
MRGVRWGIPAGSNRRLGNSAQIGFKALWPVVPASMAMPGKTH